MTPWVLLRGLTRERRHWGEFLPRFAASQPGAQVLALDLPGNGALHRLRSPASVPALAAHCRDELARQGHAPPYHLLALSLGAMAAVAWAQHWPREVAGCVLVNTSLRPFSPWHHRLRPSAWAPLALMPLRGAAAQEATVLRLTSRHAPAPQALLAQWIGYRQDCPVSAANALRQLLAAARYRAPPRPPLQRLLLLSGAGDALVDPSCSRRLARAWGVAHAEHPSAGHDLPLDDGAWVVEQVTAWQRGTPAATCLHSTA